MVKRPSGVSWKRASALIAAAAILAVMLRFVAPAILLGLLLRGSVPVVQPEVLYPVVLSGEDVVLLDAREKNEYQVSHLPKAIWVGHSDFDFSRVAGVPKNSRIVIYCSVGVRSKEVGQRLLKGGYSDVRNLYGGIFGWVDHGYPVVDSYGNATDRVHAYSRLWGLWLKNGIRVYD